MRTESFTKKDGNTLEFKMVIEGDELNRFLSESSKELQKTRELPGFRKGRIPLEMMLSQFGNELYVDTANRHAAELFAKAAADNSLEPVGKPLFAITSADAERMTISTVVHVYPDVTLHKYCGLEVKRLRDEVTEEELDEALEEFRDLHRNVVTAECPAGKDDIVYFSYAIECDGKSIPSGAGSHVFQRLDREEMFPGLADRMKGAVPGDEFTMEIDMPADHKRTELRGKHITLFVRIEEVKERRLMPLTDELVCQFNRGCETVESFREKLRREKNRYLKITADEAFEKALKAELAAQVEANIPPEMMELQLELLYRNLENGLLASGSNIQRFMQDNGYTPDKIRELSLPTAEQEIKFALALDKVAELEGITVTDSELEKEYAARAKRCGVTVESIKSMESDADIIEDIRNEKVLNLVRDTATAVYEK